MFTDLWQFYHAFYVSLYSLHLFPLFKTGGERGGDSNWDYLLLHMTSFFRFMGLLIFPFFHVFLLISCCMRLTDHLLLFLPIFCIYFACPDLIYCCMLDSSFVIRWYPIAEGVCQGSQILMSRDMDVVAVVMFCLLVVQVIVVIVDSRGPHILLCAPTTPICTTYTPDHLRH